MGKRKPQNAVTETESGPLDIVESERTSELVKTNCQHIGRAIDSNSIKKSLKADNLKALGCCICSKEGVQPEKEENWVCLQCGARLCCLEHVKNHFDVPRSNLHAIAFSIHNFNIWCEPCKSLIPAEENKKLKICVGIIKQMMDKSKQVQIVVTPYNEDTPPPLVEWNESNDSQSAKTPSTSTTTNNKVPSRTDYFSRPSVRGLVNLGNTCFFNSVLQCLARTPKLVDNLRILETEEEEFKITLKNGQILEGTLERSNDWLGQCLADTLVALSKPNETTSVSPLKLLQHLRKKCPQFEGYDQHDAHELLRHLLDSVRMNDLKRYRSLVLNKLGLSRKVNPQNVSPELHKRVKALDNEVMERVTLVPEPVFKGLLVSTLECQECKNTSQCVESFLDLSLPIMADKPQPPSMIRRKGSASPELVDDKAGGISKHQLKKQAKQARKKGRNKYGEKTAGNAAPHPSFPPPTDSHSDKGESEADVEDNEEEKPHESGYSSEKIHSESSSLSGGDDSARTSPTTHVKEDESNNTRVAVCEGLVTVGGSTGPPPSSLNPQPQYIPFLRFRRKPQESWVRAGGSLTPTWIPHSDTTYIPSPLMVMDGGESWRNYAPRNGLSPCSPLPKKDSQLNPIIEESDKAKCSESASQETSVCDQVSLMSKVVETMLAQVHISQQDLDIYERNVVTDCRNFIVNDYKEESDWDKDNSPTGGGDCSRLSSNNVDNPTQQISSFNPFNNESCPAADKNPDTFDPPLDSQNSNGIRQNLTNVTPESENSLSNILDNKKIEENHTVESTSELIKTEQGHNTPISATDDTSNGFHINSLYDRKSTSSRDNENKEKEAADSYCPKIGPVDDRTERQKDKNYSDEDKESIDLSPIFKEVVNNKKVEKKEEGESVKYRRRFNDKDSMSRNQESESDCSVQSCLSQFTALEIMSGANRVGCSTCTQRHNKGNKEGKTVNTIASKQLLIKEAPQVLILHLKRFQVQMYSFKKLSKHVFFPLCLDLSPFCLQEVEREEDGRIMYSLYGVVEHSGNLNGGHYVAYIKVEDEEKSCRWFCISDSYVHEVSESRVLQSQAYLLFYRRILMDESS